MGIQSLHIAAPGGGLPIDRGQVVPQHNCQFERVKVMQPDDALLQGHAELGAEVDAAGPGPPRHTASGARKSMRPEVNTTT